MTIPLVYRKSREQNLITFNFTDAATGTGFITHFAGTIVSGALGTLSQNAFFSTNVLHFAQTFSASVPTSIVAMDFDLKIDKPFRIEGDMLIEVPFAVYPGGTTTHNMNARTTIQRVDVDSVVSEISAEVSGANVRQVGSNNTFADTMTSCNVIPRTLLKPGESLRVKVEAFGWEDAGGGGNYLMGFDPRGRLTQDSLSDANGTFPAGANTIMKVHIPIKVDI